MKFKLIIWIVALLLIVTSVYGACDPATELEPFTMMYHSNDDADRVGLNITDTSGNNRWGWTTANVGGVGILNQSLSYVLGADHTIVSNLIDARTIPAFSISMWINSDNFLDNDYIFDNGQFRVITYQGSILFGNTAGMIHNCANDVWDTATWYYLTMVWGGENNQDSLQMYINGTNYTNTCTDLGAFGGWGDTVRSLYMGERSDTGYHWGGDLDEIAFFNDSISVDCSSFLYNAGGPTSTQQYNFSGGGPVPTTNFSITAQDEWNSTSITSFNVTFDGVNYGSNSTGVVEVDILTNDTTLHNITVWGATDYFNRTYTEYNISLSGALAAELHQSEVCFNASSRVNEEHLTGVTFTINGVSETCYNISTGTYSIQADKLDWFSINQSVTITPLLNITTTIVNMSYANLTIYAIDGTTGEGLSGYDLSIGSVNYSWSGQSETGVTNHSFYLINETYNTTINMPGYAITGTTINITVDGDTNYTFTLYKSNSVSITILDEITNLPIYDDITIRWSYNATTWENVTNTSSLFIHNITATNYTLLFYSSNYSTRTYSITVGPQSSQFLTAYMISSTYSTIFTIKDIDTGTILDEVSIAMYKLINSSWTVVESKVSDISGKSQFYYDPIANYRFYLSNDMYNDYVFYLNPILFSTYDVFMTKSSVLNYTVDFDDISFIYSPTTFYNDQNIIINFLISSPTGQLTDYGITVTYPGGNDSDSGVNAIGEQMSAMVNISGATTFDYVILDFNYTTTVGGFKTYKFNLPINSNVTTGTWLTNKDKTYGLGIFERMLIATIIIIFVVGIATMVGQALPGVALGMFVFMFLVFIGFVPIWVILPSMLMGIIFLVWKSGGY